MQSVRDFPRQEKKYTFHSIQPAVIISRWQEIYLEVQWLIVIMYRIDFNLGKTIQYVGKHNFNQKSNYRKPDTGI